MRLKAYSALDLNMNLGEKKVRTREEMASSTMTDKNKAIFARYDGKSGDGLSM